MAWDWDIPDSGGRPFPLKNWDYYTNYPAETKTLWRSVSPALIVRVGAQVTAPDVTAGCSLEFVGIPGGPFVISTSALGSGKWGWSATLANNPSFEGYPPGVYEWYCVATTNSGVYTSPTYTFTVHLSYPPEPSHSKTTNPTPANNATEVDWSTPALSWNGNGDTYTVRVSKFSSFVASDIVAEGIGTMGYTLTQAQKGNLAGLTDKLYWRVDSTSGEETLTGDTWSFDPRPGKATIPVPFDGTTDVGLKPLLYWALPEAVDTVSAYIQREGTLEVVALLEDEAGATSYADWSDYLDHGKTYSWRVDTANEYGETEGDTWIFKTLFFDPILASWENYPGKTLGPVGYYDEGGEAVGPGVLGVDYYWTGMNAKRTTGRLVAATASAIWYEGVT